MNERAPHFKLTYAVAVVGDADRVSAGTRLVPDRTHAGVGAGVRAAVAERAGEQGGGGGAAPALDAVRHRVLIHDTALPVVTVHLRTRSCFRENNQYHNFFLEIPNIRLLNKII